MQTFFERYSGRFLFFIALFAFTIFILQYGFYIPEKFNIHLTISNFIVFGLFIFYQVGRIIYSENIWEYLKTRWLDTIILILIFFHTISYILFTEFFSDLAHIFKIYDLNLFYIIVIQIYIVVSLFIKATRLSHLIAEYRIQPSKVFMFSFLFLILFGTGLLLLPKATVSGKISFIDALFTSTSAVCVTGLTVVDTATYFTRAGQIVILILIQIGGLGVMTLTTFFALFFAGGLGIKERVMISDLIEEDKLGKIKYTLIQIILTTLIIEAVGAVLIFNSLKSINMPLGEKIFHSAFHSISAFCNAGFSSFSENMMFIHFRFNYLSVFTVGTLIILGGIGFGTFSNILESISNSFKNNRIRVRSLTTQTKIVLWTSFFLIIIGSVFTLFAESENTLKNLTFDQKILASIFQSITTRTAGFNTIPINELQSITLLFYMFLMFIGASPGGTGGGIKTTSAFLIYLSIINFMRGRKKIEIYNRTIPDDIIHRVFTKVIFSLLLLFTTTILLTSIEKFSFIDLIFEQVSAFGTVGLSRGITPFLTNYGKMIIIILMFIGRIGPITFLTVFAKEKIQARYDYPSEYISTI